MTRAKGEALIGGDEWGADEGRVCCVTAGEKLLVCCVAAADELLVCSGV